VSRVVGVFGGSFNPPHLAHLLAATTVLATSEVDEVLVIPAFRHPFGKPLAPYEDRVAMCRMAMGWLPRVRVSRVEEELGGESKTLRTLEHLAAREPSWSLRLVMGADLVREAPRWHAFDRIRALAPPLVLGRAGVEGADVPPALLPAVSSTMVRTMIGEARWDELALLLPREVLAHVRARGLYAGAA